MHACWRNAHRLRGARPAQAAIVRAGPGAAAVGAVRAVLPVALEVTRRRHGQDAVRRRGGRQQAQQQRAGRKQHGCSRGGWGRHGGLRKRGQALELPCKLLDRSKQAVGGKGAGAGGLARASSGLEELPAAPLCHSHTSQSPPARTKAPGMRCACSRVNLGVLLAPLPVPAGHAARDRSTEAAMGRCKLEHEEVPCRQVPCGRPAAERAAVHGQARAAHRLPLLTPDPRWPSWSTERVDGIR